LRNAKQRNQINETVKRSALRYFGGKWAIAPWVIAHMPPQRVYVELLERLRSGKGRAMVAGYPSELYDRMLKGWQRTEREHMAAGSKRRRTEVLWISPG
jgi:site-specific DNA-adenine methylase